jgi:hypothetical protein
MQATAGGPYTPVSGTSPQTVSAGATSTSVVLPAAAFTPAAALYSISVTAANAIGTGTAVATASPVAPVTAVSSKTVVLSSTTMNALTSSVPPTTNTIGTLVWDAPAPSQVTALKTGQALVASPVPAAPSGLLDDVSSISADSAGDYTITTTPASLNTVFTSLAVASSDNPLIPPSGAGSDAGPTARRDGGTFHPSVAGVRNLGAAGQVRPNASISYSQTLSLGFDYNTGNAQAGASVSGEVDVTPQLGLSVTIDHGFADIPNGAAITASATATVADTVTAEAHLAASKQLGEIDGDPIDIQVGPVPLIIVPKMPITLSVDGTIGMQVKASVTVGGSLSWNSHNATHLTTANLSTAPTITAGPLPGQTTTGSLDVTLAVEPQLDIYDIGGPNIKAAAVLSGAVNLDPPAGSAYLSVTPSIELSAGLDVDILDVHASFEQTLATLTFKAFQILKAPTAVLTITPAGDMVLPGKTLQLTATRSDGATGHTITWTLVGAAGDTISSGGLLTAANPPGRTVTVDAVDDTGAAGQTTVQIGTPFDPVGDLQATQDSNALTGEVDWTAPANTGGSALDSYTVLVSGGIPSQTVTGIGAGLTGLHPGVTYTITVYPTNSTGQTGPAATTTLYVIPLCTDTFTGGTQGTGTTWTTAANWDSGHVPTASDWVCTQGDNVSLPGAVTVQGIQQPGGTLTLPSKGTLTITNTYSDSGVLSGPGTVTVPAGSTLTLAPGFALAGGVRLVNKGSGEVQQGYYNGQDFSGGSVLENAGTLTLDDNANPGFDSDGNAGNEVVNDSGATISYASTDAGGAEFYVPVLNNGTITVTGGTLSISALAAGGSGAFSGAGTFELGGGVLATSQLTGVQNLEDGPGGLELTGSTPLAALKTLSVAQGPLTVDSALTMPALHTADVESTLSGPGTVTVPAGSTLTLAPGFALAGGVRLVNKGSGEVQGCQCSAPESFAGGSVLENAGTLTIDNGADPGYDSDNNTGNEIINDAGATMTTTSGTDEDDIDVPLVNNGSITGSGNLDIDSIQNVGSVVQSKGTLTAGLTQTAGFLQIAKGAKFVPVSRTSITGGSLMGAGTYAGPFSGGATVAPSLAGAPLTITGTFKPSASGSLQVLVNGSATAGTSYSQLKASGDARLTGTLAISTGSSYAPVAGTQLTIVSAKSVTGTFATTTGASYSGGHWAVSYTSTSVVLTAAAD